MAPPVKVEVVLSSLKNCLVNLPPNLVTLISNTNAPVQNVIVELQYRSQTLSSNAVSSGNATGFPRTAYTGWTGMPSRSRPASVLQNERARGGRESEIQTVDIDISFAKTLGLSEGQQIGLLIHLNPPLAQTVNIEPLTPADWEVIELHATFLELNFLSQIRALPNPASQAEQFHPLTLHLSPTSTANIKVTKLSPPLASTQLFARIAPDAEVIVAPKSRARPTRSVKGDARSTASRRSGKSGTSVKAGSKKTTREKDAMFLRGVDVTVAQDFVKTSEDSRGLTVWVGQSVLASEALRNSAFVNVSIIKPAGLRVTPEQNTVQRLKEEDSSNAGRPAAKIVARVVPWTNCIDQRYAILSSDLTNILGVPSMSGLLIRIESASTPLHRHSLRSFSFFPFSHDSPKRSEELKFGGDSNMSKQALIDRLRITHGNDNGMLSGPLTDGMLLLPSGSKISTTSFDGGILRFNLSERDVATDGEVPWVLGGEQKQEFDVKEPIPHPVDVNALFPTFTSNLPPDNTNLIGVEKTLEKCMSNVTLCSSVLLTGGIGSGKTAMVGHIGHRLRQDYLFNVTYFSCQELVNDETRVSAIKQTLTRLFMSAAWCARLGGQSIVILDDLDKICPVETELQVGNDNGRSRQITEILCAAVRQYCSIQSKVALLATTQSKDALNNIIIGGHIVGDIISLPAPTKEIRRDILESLMPRGSSHQQIARPSHSRTFSDSNSITDNSWMNPSNPSSRPGSSSSDQVDGFHVSPSLDLLDVAGKTDGYMPADLTLLVSRARNESLIRTVTATTDVHLTISKADFDAALRNFTPSSLRNVTLTHSNTTFSSVGGLSTTRNTLLETLLYPTKYAPIFARSPLRLRSGLLLYGYPGCGKTLLASAVAGECNLNFISVKGPEILNKYIGASEKSVRDLFDRAQAAKPCVLFFDEFDSIAPKRGHDSTGVTDRVVNQMLTQMDGAEGLDGVYVLAATSRPDLIDPALLRPGRLDKSLLCDMPDAKDREDILRAVSEKLQLSQEVAARLSSIATKTEGFSGADLQALMYNAHLEAIHDLLKDTTISKVKPVSAHKDLNKQSRGKKAEKQDFIQFLYGKAEDETAKQSVTSSALDSPSVIAAKLEELKLARKRDKASVRGLRPNSQSEQGGEDYKNEVEKDDAVIIDWHHIERSLSTTRSSISPQERRRLGAIYHEFVQGRNGEMPNGEGNREVGGRTSLM